MNFHYQLNNNETGMLMDVGGWIPDLEEIEDGCRGFGEVEFAYWANYDAQNEDTAQGVCRVDVGRGDNGGYEVLDVILKEVSADEGIDSVSKELEYLLLDKLEYSLKDELDWRVKYL